MDSCSLMRKQAQPIVRKGKKKEVKDEVDRIKQAEKKKRRLEKAIATSAAIRAELEKKKQKKKEGQQKAADEEEENLADAAAKKKQEKDELERIRLAEKINIRLEKSVANSVAIRVELEKKKLKKLEEQRRLDEEGAAIAEAVALHVLLGEDCDDGSYQIMLNQEMSFKPWDYTAKFNIFTGGSNRFFPHQRCSSYAIHSSNRQRDSNWSSVSYERFARGWDNNNMGISADLIAAQAVSSLQISENPGVDSIVSNDLRNNDVVLTKSTHLTADVPITGSVSYLTGYTFTGYSQKNSGASYF